MFTPFALMRHDPALRLTAMLLFLVGAFSGTLAPYSSILGVGIFGLGDRGYAVVIVVASLIGVAAAVAAGLIADQRANRRRIALTCATLTALAVAELSLFPSRPGFVLAHAVLLPAGGAIYGQVFALARLAASTRPAAERDAILTSVRALFALPFVLVLPVLSLAIRHGMPLMALYPLLTGLALVILVLIWRHWPRDGATAWNDKRSGLTLRRALGEVMAPAVAVRVGLTGILGSGSTLYMALTGLVFTTVAGRGEGDVALYVGGIAGLEVPVMLLTPWLMRHFSKTALMAAGALIFALHLTLLAPLAATRWVWLLMLPGAAGGAIYIAIPIAYLQDLMSERPGAGSSLLALQGIAGNAAAALAFVAGTALSGYGLAAVFGAGLAVSAGLALVWVDMRAQDRVKKPAGA